MQGFIAAEYFFRRQLWLLVFGLFNAYILLWFGDILFSYAICGMILFAFRRLSVNALIVGALLSLLFVTLRENRELYRNKELIAKGERIARVDTTVIKLTDGQKDDLNAMLTLKENSGHEAKLKNSVKEISALQGNYKTIYALQSKKSLHAELFYTFFIIGDILVFMLLGMAFCKNGILLGNASIKVYWLMCIGGLSIGLTLSYLRLQPLIISGFNAFAYNKG